MVGLFKRWGFGILILAAAALVAGCSSAGASPQVFPSPSGAQTGAKSTLKAPSNGLVQSHSGGAVDIEVEWGGEQNGNLVFEVGMNTHSVDLDQYDLAKLATLRDDSGKEYRPVSWSAEPGGHHRSGTLTFPIPDSVGQGKARYLDLVIKDVAGVKERVLKWQLG
ncbi:MAG: hypothetical protein Q8O76_10700 [Chloroflexota bacterium]|nr:hypothetical protein [Chloroflexota bacterium]